jgi:3-phenylpropionate/trans-cinnamate dioxygenase ferredoxin subunit
MLTMSDFELVARLEDLPEGELLGVVTTTGERVCLANCRGQIVAMSNVCTHQEFEMALGTIQPDATIECAWHGTRFDCRTGAVIEGPATDPLPTYEVRIEGEDVLIGPRKS